MWDALTANADARPNATFVAFDARERRVGAGATRPSSAATAGSGTAIRTAIGDTRRWSATGRSPEREWTPLKPAATLSVAMTARKWAVRIIVPLP